MIIVLAQTSYPTLPWGWMVLGLVAAAFLALALLFVHFGMIYLRALFSGAKVTAFTGTRLVNDKTLARLRRTWRPGWFDPGQM